MQTRKKTDILNIQPVALNLFQFFNPNEMRTYSLLDKSTAATTAKFLSMHTVKKSIAVNQKSLSSLKNDVKKMQEFTLDITDPVLRTQLQLKLREIEEGKIDKGAVELFENTEWKCRSKTQDVCESIGAVTGKLGESFYNDHLKDKNKVTKEEILILLFFYGISGISYATQYTLGVINEYFAKPIKQQFQARLRFLAHNIDEKNEEKAFEPNQLRP